MTAISTLIVLGFGFYYAFKWTRAGIAALWKWWWSEPQPQPIVIITVPWNRPRWWYGPLGIVIVIAIYFVAFEVSK